MKRVDSLVFVLYNSCVKMQKEEYVFGRRRGLERYTFLYNPKPDYPPVTREKLLNDSWDRVSRSIVKAFADLSNEKIRR